MWVTSLRRRDFTWTVTLASTSFWPWLLSLTMNDSWYLLARYNIYNNNQQLQVKHYTRSF